MSKLVGVGAVSERESKETLILKSQIAALREENGVLRTEKEDLEKIATELKAKVDDLEKKTPKKEK